MWILPYHISSFLIGFLIDMVLGDPYWLPHPIRLIGNLISKLEDVLLNNHSNLSDKSKRRRGSLLVVIVLLLTGITTTAILVLAYKLHFIVGILVESVMTYQILATKCLKTESMKVYQKLVEGDVSGARYAVSMIVGRDTASLNEEGIIKAAVETVAENSSDGVIAPMLYLAIGGPILGFLYKAINTMDSMIGYKNDKYLFVGRTAAYLDDIVNYIPARMSAFLMIMGAFIGGKEFDGKRAFRIYRRDRYNHASPNSAQTEATCAGALGIQLAGDGIYLGKIVEKPLIGDATRNVEVQDIARVNKLLYLMAFLCQGICLMLLCLANLL